MAPGANNEDKRFTWRSDDDLSDIAQVSANAHMIKKGTTEDFDGARVTVKFHNRDVAQEFKAFLMQKGNVNRLESIPKLEELNNGQVQVAFSTYSPELCRGAIEKLGESDFPGEEVTKACSALKLDNIAQAQKRGMSR
jgi:hypothetical protein